MPACFSRSIRGRAKISQRKGSKNTCAFRRWHQHRISALRVNSAYSLRAYMPSKRSYVIHYRFAGRSRRFTIGLHGYWTPSLRDRRQGSSSARLRVVTIRKNSVDGVAFSRPLMHLTEV